MALKPRIVLTNEMLLLIASIDEFKGEWSVGGNVVSERLQALRQVATIESAGSSTRIEGARLTDPEVKALLGGLQSRSFRSRDEQEVAGYAHAMETVQESWRSMPLTKGIVLQLHRDILRYSTRDERHRGAWKKLPNHVVALGHDGEELGVVFETASPFDTPRLMEELLEWYEWEESAPTLHPLLRISVFVVVFLAIHPFQDGNGRLSRVLNNLLLLREGYGFVSYSSLENVIEHSKDAYYLALRRTQATLYTEATDWEPWVLFFLRSMETQTSRLKGRIEKQRSRTERSGPHLSPLAEHVARLLVERGTLTVAEAVLATGANRNTLKGKFRELVRAGEAELHGKGRGAHYRPPGA